MYVHVYFTAPVCLCISVSLEEECGTQDTGTEGSSRRKVLDKNASAVNVIRFLVHKVRKLDPAYIKYV